MEHHRRLLADVLHPFDSEGFELVDDAHGPIEHVLTNRLDRDVVSVFDVGGEENRFGCESTIKARGLEFLCLVPLLSGCEVPTRLPSELPRGGPVLLGHAHG